MGYLPYQLVSPISSINQYYSLTIDDTLEVILWDDSHPRLKGVSAKTVPVLESWLRPPISRRMLKPFNIVFFEAIVRMLEVQGLQINTLMNLLRLIIPNQKIMSSLWKDNEEMKNYIRYIYLYISSWCVFTARFCIHFYISYEYISHINVCAPYVYACDFWKAVSFFFFRCVHIAWPRRLQRRNSVRSFALRQRSEQRDFVADASSNDARRGVVPVESWTVVNWK